MSTPAPTPTPTPLAADFSAILDGQASDAEIHAFLERSIGLMGDADALVAGAQALRARMVRVNAPAGAIDVCGTGGDGAHTLNISTTVAFVVAGCGVSVAKHGNRAMSSKSGAADVLEALGVTLSAEPSVLERALNQAGVAFLFAQNHHPAMRHVAGPRKALGKRTIFNLLGPLSNPAGVTRQLVGVFDPAFAAPMAHALTKLGADRVIAVHGFGGWDELSTAGANTAIALHNGAHQTLDATAESAGLRAFDNAAVAGGDAATNAHALRTLLEGSSSNDAYRDVVALNAAAALIVAGKVQTLRDGADMAKDAIASGAALRALNALIDITRSAP